MDGGIKSRKGRTGKARGDKEKLKPEIDGIIEELKEDGGKVTTKEIDDGYDITIEKDTK